MYISCMTDRALLPSSQHPPSARQLVRFSLNKIGRDIAVGDIHGCFTELQAALKAIGFNPIKDRLFSVGDLVDRGPESDKVLQWLDKPWFHAICGNHEQMVFRSALGNPLPDIDHLKHGGEWLEQQPEKQRRAIGERLAALPLAFEVETRLGPVGLVHADYPFDDWRDIQRLQLSPAAIDSCLWSRERYSRRYERSVANVRALIHGHTTLGRVEKLGNVFFIDTGGWRRGQGHFTLLDLHTLEPLLPVKARGASAAAVTAAAAAEKVAAA